MKKHLKRAVSLAMAVSMAASVAVTASAKTVTLQPSGYTIETGDNAPEQSENATHYGGNTGLFTYDDFTDLAAYPEAKDAVNWWLSSGVTNGGKTFTTFGADDEFYRYDLAFFFYRFYSIVNDDGQWFYDDVPLNQMGSTIGLKFNDAVSNVRWSGIMGGIGSRSEANADPVTGLYGESCFDPFGSVTAESLLISLYRLINYTDGTLGSGHPDVTGETTMQLNANFDYTVSAVSDTEADSILSGTTVHKWAKSIVAAMVNQGLYDVKAGDDLTAPMTKLEVIETLYKICAGTGGNHTMTEAYIVTSDDTKTYSTDTDLTGESWYLGGETEAKAENAVVINDGATVNLTDSEVTYGKIEASVPYPLAYRWGNCADILVYGEGTTLNIENTTLNFITEGDTASSFSHQSVMGIEVETGAVVHLKNVKTVGNTSAILCYDGTIIYEDSALQASDRVTSSDFFSGIVVYDNTTVNQGTDTVGGGFSDEAASTYVINSDYFGAGSGNQTGISTFYAYKSNMVMSATSCTNNTSMLSDVASTILEDCTVKYTGSIANVVREGKLIIKYINCGEVTLGELKDGEYDISVTGTEYGSAAAVRVYVDGSTFSRDLKVFVAPGCSLEVIYTGDNAPVVTQDTSATKTVECFANTEILPSIEATNTGSVTVTQAK
jgi:hypothetical protein